MTSQSSEILETIQPSVDPSVLPFVHPSIRLPVSAIPVFLSFICCCRCWESIKLSDFFFLVAVLRCLFLTYYSYLLYTRRSFLKNWKKTTGYIANCLFVRGGERGTTETSIFLSVIFTRKKIFSFLFFFFFVILIFLIVYAYKGVVLHTKKSGLKINLFFFLLFFYHNHFSSKSFCCCISQS